MSGIAGLVVIVSKLGGLEDSFFPEWGVTEPQDSPFVSYVNGDGSECSGDQAQVALVQGKESDLPKRVVTAIRAGADVGRAFLLVHTGGGALLAHAIEGKSVSDEVLPDWFALLKRSFALKSGEGLYDFIRAELAPYAARRIPGLFSNALALLRTALTDALESRPGGAEIAEARSDYAVEVLTLSEKRTAAGLPKNEPPRPPRNPVAALIHDVVSRFDALLIDLQTGADDPDYWRTTRARYRGSVGNDLQSLCRLLTEADSEVPNLDSLATIAGKIAQYASVDRERNLLQETTTRLEALVPKVTTIKAFELLFILNEGTRNEVTREDFDRLHSWLSDLRRELVVVDTLYKRCVLKVGTGQDEESSPL